MTNSKGRRVVRNVATGPHTSKQWIQKQVFRIDQTRDGGNPNTHWRESRRARLAARKIFAWGRDLGANNNKLYLSYIAVGHSDGTKAHISELMDQLKAQNEAAGREFRWTYGPEHKGKPSTIWSLRYTNVDHTITGTTVYGL
jgi:hypothetical protein